MNSHPSTVNPPPSVIPGGKGVILAVDDTPASLKLLADTLTGAGYQVRPADSGELALASVAASPPELILLDIRMPGLDGFEVFRRLKAQENSRSIPIVFISASREVEERVMGLKLGAVDFITKPFQREELLARVETHLALSQARTRLEQQGVALRLANEQLQKDITERKQMEVKLRETRAILQAALDQSTAGIAVASAPDGKLQYVNDAGLLIRGGSRESIVEGVGIDRYVESWRLLDLDGTPLKTEQVPLARAVMFGETNRREFIIRREDGDDRVVLATAAPIRDEKGVVTAGIVVFLDITERKASEAALRHAEEKYRVIFENALEGIYQTTPEGTFLAVNPAVARILGYASPEELMRERHDIAQQGYADPRDREEFKRRIETDGAVNGFEYEAWRKDGSKVWVSENARTVRDPAGRVIYYEGSMEDITARKQAEADRLTLGKLESTGVLAGGMAHDFNNLLTVILLNLDLARSGRGSGVQVTDCLQRAQQTTLAAQKLTQQLLTFARGGEPVTRLADLGSLLREWVQYGLSGSAVAGRFTFDRDLWLAEVDEGQFGQVIRNLVLNAREAMPQGGVVSIRAENVVLGADNSPPLPPGDYLQVSVTDDGGGIPPEVLPKIFDPYFSTRQRGVQKGMGLGLTICHSIIQKHRGAITVESVPGTGTTFHVWLPARREQMPLEEAKPASVESGPRSGRILVMDDEENIRNVMAPTLELMGYTVSVAADGQEAVDLYGKARQASQSIDLVILDLTVKGGMGGLEAVRQLRSMNPAIKAVVMSGYADNKVLQEYEHHGFRGALQKPFTAETLRAVLDRVLGAPM